MGELGEDGKHSLRCDGRKTERGLVEEQKPGLADERPHERDHLLFAAAQSAGELTEAMAAELTRLAGTDWLSVRALAARILESDERSVPNPPVTKPAREVRAAFHELLKGHE